MVSEAARAPWGYSVLAQSTVSDCISEVAVGSSRSRSSRAGLFRLASAILVFAIAVLPPSESLAQPTSSSGPRPNRVGVTPPTLTSFPDHVDSRLLALTFHPECLGQSVRGAAIGIAAVGLLGVLLDVPANEDTGEDRTKARRRIFLSMAAAGAIVFAVGMYSACDATPHANPHADRALLPQLRYPVSSLPLVVHR